MSESILDVELDTIFASTPLGSLNKAMYLNVRGFDAYQQARAILPSKEQQGYLFITRPQLNMQKDNIRNYTPMYHLLDEDPNGVALAVRNLLDPRLATKYELPLWNMETGKEQKVSRPPVKSNLIDNENAFIPFFTNNVISSTGWGDMTLPLSSTDAGIYKQSYAHVDGISRNYGEWDLSVNIQNMKGDISIMLMQTWINYCSLVKEEYFIPYYDYLINDRVDYNSRAYRVILDSTRQKVTKILACGAMIPTSVPFGMYGDFNSKQPFAEQTKEIALRFRCMGQFQNDARLITSFNGVVSCFNASMYDDYRDKEMVLVPYSKLPLFQGYIYPRINPDTLAFEWWAKKEYASKVLHSPYLPYSEV